MTVGRDPCVAPAPQVPGCRESEAGVQSLSEKVEEGRVYGVVEARDLRPIGSSAKKSVAHAPPAFSADDLGNAFSSEPSGACVRGLFFRRRWSRQPPQPPQPRRGLRALRARSRAPVAVAVFSCALETAGWYNFCFTAAGADGHGPMSPLFLHCSASPERRLQICVTFAKTLIRSQRIHFHVFLG